MSPGVFVALCLAGGVGAAMRFVVDGLVRSRVRSPFPWGTAVINVSGSFILGFLTGLAASALLTPQWVLVLGTGLMGGYTTFSTASIETVRLIQEREWVMAFSNGILVLVATVAVGFGGLWLGSVL
ncbi:fluoride efflux transporter CrcB [Planctomonas sp. JC2975]|uniref:fluoride efflux transporter CrcB n=1 Tax=Planctomonas sp. JC2975 TaxID=2729626 RepID=UPI001472B444|nr:fluoride efflux transporter CrcB [Planctomonas sp. JC2975]